ncbi:MAG TPA: MATE family efflux transporter [Spirochaetia bacterium]|nr:MATE family efflux transporter [Spirochaetales bacterium]HRY80064.1 MATE family efflux transporter [Spirochaetia bacterium]HRZ88534.1 MATE family efflux transporter [Spirochaetia bacterium]
MRNLTEGSETKEIILFALPMLIGNVFQQLYNMVDSIVVGQFVGKQALAAVGSSFAVLFLMIALIMGVTMGFTILIAQYFGARDKAKVRAVVDTAYIVLFWAALVLSVVGVLAVPLILKVLRVPADVAPEAGTYLRILFAGSLATFGYNGVAAILRGIGDSKTPLYLLIAASFLNIALDLLFVIAFGWGVAGVAWATIISQAASFLGALVLLNKRNEYVRLSVKELKFDPEMFRLSLKLGIPSGIQQTLVAAGMMVLTRVVNTFGTDVMAGFSAASRLDTFAMMPTMNLGMAVSTFTGQNLGAGKPERVRRGHSSALLVGLGISVFIGVVMVFGGPGMVRLFTRDPEVVRIGARYLLIVGAFYSLFTIMFVNNGVLRGAGDVMIPMVNTLLALWIVRIPTAVALSSRMGPDGIWWSIPAGWLMGAVFSSWYYRTGRWKRKAVVKGPVEPAPAEAAST